MERPRTAERDQMRARLGDAQSFAPERLTRYAVVPLAPHEAEAVWRVGHDGVDAGGFHAAHDLEAVAVVDGHELVGKCVHLECLGRYDGFAPETAAL